MGTRSERHGIPLATPITHEMCTGGFRMPARWYIPIDCTMPRSKHSHSGMQSIASIAFAIFATFLTSLSKMYGGHAHLSFDVIFR